MPLGLALLLAEAAALIHVTQGELGQAQADGARAAQLVVAYPAVLGSLQASVHMIAGEARDLTRGWVHRAVRCGAGLKRAMVLLGPYQGLGRIPGSVHLMACGTGLGASDIIGACQGLNHISGCVPHDGG